MRRIFSPDLIANLVMTKRQELRDMSEIPARDHWKTYLETV
jgi:glutamine synthetase